MKRLSNLMLCATLACGAAAAYAGTGVKATDVPRISNGGTGFIGVTESIGMPSQPVALRWSASGTSSIPVGAGEASTIVNGRPNEDPNAPGIGNDRVGMARAPMTGELRTMGGSRNDAAMARDSALRHPAWGTPD